ncbi:hypothetical protein [Nonomuraea cavernae]|uniref:hypothetical protein n=1 Tax=Nonomuraea cavernae TaxID=2045107 RepID=UPI0033C9DDAA
MGNLGDPRWQGIGVIVSTIMGMVGIVSTVWVSRKTVEREKAATSHAVPGAALGMAKIPWVRQIAARVAGALLVWVMTWALFAGIWAVLAASMGFAPAMVFTPLFFLLGSPPAICALIAKSAMLGGFLGGGFPLGLYALEVAAAQRTVQATPLAWFVVFFILGGMLGALAATIAVTTARRLRVPLPRN